MMVQKSPFTKSELELLSNSLRFMQAALDRDSAHLFVGITRLVDKIEKMLEEEDIT
jgi:hypothetical protein